MRLHDVTHHRGQPSAPGPWAVTNFSWAASRQCTHRFPHAEPLTGQWVAATAPAGAAQRRHATGRTASISIARTNPPRRRDAQAAHEPRRLQAAAADLQPGRRQAGLVIPKVRPSNARWRRSTLAVAQRRKISAPYFTVCCRQPDWDRQTCFDVLHLDFFVIFWKNEQNRHLQRTWQMLIHVTLP